MAKKKDFYKLAQLIKLAAKDVSKEDAWWKCEDVARMIGFEITNSEPDVLEVTDDSGYRSIIIGDTRGNDIKKFHRGYACLYSEQCSYKGGARNWEYRCFPPAKEIATKLEKLYNSEYCPDVLKYYPGDDENVSFCVTYLSAVVKKYVDKIASDKRSALEIFNSCQ